MIDERVMAQIQLIRGKVLIFNWLFLTRIKRGVLIPLKAAERHVELANQLRDRHNEQNQK